MYIGLHVKCPLFLSDFNKISIFLTVFRKKKTQNFKFHENPSGENRVDPCGLTDVTKPTVAIRNFAKASPKGSKVDKLFQHQAVSAEFKS